MKLKKCLKHAFEMVLHSKIRSWLTIIGIVIGVGAVIAIMSLGTGMQQTITQQFSGLGGDILTLTAGNQRSTNIFMGGRGGGMNSFGTTTGTSAITNEPVLDRKDIQTLRSIPEIDIFDTNIRGNVKITYLGKSGTVSLIGVDQKIWSRITNLKIKEGRMLDSADHNVVVIGGRFSNNYFDKPIQINQMVTIEENVFRVVGIIDDTSTNIYMPIQMAYQVLDDKTNGIYDSIVIKVKIEDEINESINKIEERLMISRMVKESNKDFSISSNLQTQSTRSEMMSAMNTFLLAIAGVSLIVGAVGIANTMFTSVLEKTKEIGIMKAIGAKNSDILKIYIFNSAIIGLIGGILGVLFGMVLSNALPALTGEIRFLNGDFLVTSQSIILALSVSTIIGVIAGLIPAYKASKLKPVDALRYE